MQSKITVTFLITPSERQYKGAFFFPTVESVTAEFFNGLFLLWTKNFGLPSSTM